MFPGLRVVEGSLRASEYCQTRSTKLLLSDSTSGGVGLQAMRRASLRSNLIPRMVNQKMQSLSLANAAGSLPSLGPDALGDYLLPSLPNPKMEKSSGNSPYHHYSPRSVHSGTDEVSSTTLLGPQSHARSQSKPNAYSKTQHNGMSPLYRQAMLAPDRRDSGTSSGHPSRKPSSVSNASRRSSQASTQMPVAGSYDPISLGSSRKSSGISVAPGNGGSASSPSLPSLNPYTLHRLTSKFNEVTGRPPPTPLDRDTYTRSQLGKWLQEDAVARANGNLSNPSNVPQQAHNSGYSGNMGPPTAIPPHHHHNNAAMLPNRRRSEAHFHRGIRTPLPHEILNNGNRRASDPVRKPPQPDPSRLSNVQRYYSWNNMNPLPGVRNFHSQQNQMQNSQHGMHGNFGYNNFLSAGNLQVGRQRSDSNGSFFSSESGYQSNGSNMALNNAGEYQSNQYSNHTDGGANGQYYNPNYTSRHPSQAGYNMPTPPGVNENLLQENLNADMMAGMSGMFPNDQSQGFMNPAMNSQQRQFQQQHSANNMPDMYQQNYAQQHHHQFLQTPTQSGYANGEHGGASLPNYGNQNASHYGQVQRGAALSGYQGQQTYPQSSQGYYNQNYGNQYTPQAPVTPRPPSSSNNAGVANVNRLRMARMRNSNQRVQPSSTMDGQVTNQVDNRPNTEIPISYLEQEFIDSIPSLRVSETFDDVNKDRGYMKMPADSTTGPDDGVDSNEPKLRRPPEMDDNFDAMSGTNTDVTLPSMSGLSSRLATPTLEKPYSASLQQQELNEQMTLNVADCWDVSPSANMALNSMSSMLSTLAEENKFLQMMPQ